MLEPTETSHLETFLLALNSWRYCVSIYLFTYLPSHLKIVTFSQTECFIQQNYSEINEYGSEERKVKIRCKIKIYVVFF